MSLYCNGCKPERSWGWGSLEEPAPHRALVIAGSISNIQQRTMKFETSREFSAHTTMECDFIINIGKKALLSFLYEEDRPMLALDSWLGNDDTAKQAQQMTPHHYNFNVLAIDTATDREIQRLGTEKLYGTPVYIIGNGNIALRDYDPDGSTVLFDIPRIS